MKYKVTLEIEFAAVDSHGNEPSALGYPAGWFEGALEHLFETYNDDESLVAVKYQFDGMEKPLEIGAGS